MRGVRRGDERDEAVECFSTRKNALIRYGWRGGGCFRLPFIGFIRAMPFAQSACSMDMKRVSPFVRL